MASVSLVSVSKVFPSKLTAVNNINLDVCDGEFLVLLGPSGCGKSTTLRLIAGLENATDGEIRIGRCVVNNVAPKDRDIAMVFQDYALYPHLSVYKNIAFGLELRYGGNSLHRTWKRLTSPTVAANLAAKHRGIRDAVRQTAQALGIKHLLDRMPRQLSGGERQRVALGRAIVRQPAVFLLDEPLSNLDAKLRSEMRQELHEFHERVQTTTIYVTHDQTEAMTLGDRVAVMNHGKIEQIGTPMEVYDRPESRFVAEFIGSPPMNIISGTTASEHDDLFFVAAGVKIRLNARKLRNATSIRNAEKVNLGIRSQHIAVERGDATEGVFCGKVIRIEPLGDCKLIHVTNGSAEDASLVCKVEPNAEFETGDCARLRFNHDNLHLFDAVSGKSLLPK
jgi:multiple sugar transport system ATP-binding protein